MNHWRKTVEPYASRWAAVIDYARGHGLVHGMQAHELLDPGPGHTWSPYDTAMFLRDMVEAGELIPVKRDVAGAGYSVRAFMGLQGLKKSKPYKFTTVADWLDFMPSQTADAHLWTFRTP